MAGAGGFLQWPPNQGECHTILGREPSQTTRPGLGYPPANPSLGILRTRPPAPGSRSPTRAAVPLRSCPRGEARNSAVRWSALRAGEGDGRPGQHDPAEPIPDSGPPHFLPRREGGDIPRASPPGRPPRPLAAVAETRPGHEGPPVWVPFPGLGGPRWDRRAARRATRTAPCPLPDSVRAPEYPGSAATDAQVWRGKCPA